jgi:hypothetical protein
MKTRIALGGAALALWCALTLAQTRLPSEQTAPAPPAAEPAPAAGAPAPSAPGAPAPAAPSQEEVIPLEPPPAIRLPGAPEVPAPEQAAPQTPQVAPVTSIFTVGDIKIEGLQRVSEGTVYNYLPVNIGDRLTPARVREAIKALYATGFVRDVQWLPGGHSFLVTGIDFSGMASTQIWQLSFPPTSLQGRSWADSFLSG